MKKSGIKTLIRYVLREMQEDHGLGFSHNVSFSQDDNTMNKATVKEEFKDKDMDAAKEIANELFSDVYLVNFIQEVRGVKIFEVVLHGSDGPRHALKKDKDGKWYRYKSDEITAKWVPVGDKGPGALPPMPSSKAPAPTWNPSELPSLKMKQ